MGCEAPDVLEDLVSGEGLLGHAESEGGHVKGFGGDGGGEEAGGRMRVDGIDRPQMLENVGEGTMLLGVPAGLDQLAIAAAMDGDLPLVSHGKG